MLAHRSLSLSITLLCAGSAAACVTNPTDGGASETRTHLEFDGYAAAGLAPLQLWAWNLERSRWELVSEFLSSDETLGDDPPLYRWDHATRLGRRYWVPAASTCASTGSALFQVRELREGRWTALKTFDSAGMVCLADQLQAGETYVAAGGACTTGETVRVTGPAACVPTGRAWTLPRTLDASDGISVWRLETYPVVTSAVGRPLHLRGDAYASRAIGRITLTAEATVTCRVTGGSTLQARRTFTRTQTEGTTGGLGAGTLGVDLILDGSNLRPLCPSGTTLGQASVFSSVTAAFTDGSTGPSVAAEGTVIMPF